MFKVQIAYPHEDVVSHSFHHSMMELTDQKFQTYELTKYNIAARCVTGALVETRNEIMRTFLEDSDATHLFMVDTDMGFPADTIHKLLEPNLPVVGALCFGLNRPTHDDMGGYYVKPFAVAFDLVSFNDKDDAAVDKGLASGQGLAKNDQVFYVLKEDLDIMAGKPQQVAATGAACMLVSREAATAVLDAFGAAWFDQVGYPGGPPYRRLSEDLSFCYRLTASGQKIYVHTGVVTSHMKNVWISDLSMGMS